MRLEEGEAVEALEPLKEAEVKPEPNPNPVDLAAVLVNVTVTRANVPLSALPAAGNTCSLETRPVRVVRSGEAGAAVPGAVFGNEGVEGWRSVVVVRTMPGQEAERMWGSSIMVFFVGGCCGWGRLVGFPGEYSVSVSVAGQEAELDVSAVARLPEGRMRRKAVVSRLIHCRVEIIVLRSCEVSAMMVVLIVFSFYPGARVRVVWRVSIATQYHRAWNPPRVSNVDCDPITSPSSSNSDSSKCHCSCPCSNCPQPESSNVEIHLQKQYQPTSKRLQ